MSKPIALIVEDDPRLSDIFSETVRSAGYEIEVIADGRQAMGRLVEIEPALVVLDLHLPHVMGQEVLAYIRQQERLQKTRVMLATADAGLAASLEKQSDLVLLKPISVGQLRALALRLRPDEG
ncbi:MAG: response regulator [Chloroflexi bacterium]|nr:response regulator [Chloroflexota bacterium]